MDKQTKQDVEEFVKSLPQNIQPKVKDLQKLQSEYDTLYSQYLKELFQLKEKQREKYDPLYTERYSIINGTKDQEGIPSFWVNVLNKSEDIRNEMSEKDADILEHLVDIQCVDFGTPEEGEDIERGYKLIFKFKSNEYFSHKELEKAYFFDDIDYTILKKTQSTKISWNTGKNPKEVIKRNKKTDQKKTKVIPSFFDFFSPPTIPDNMSPGQEQQDEELFELVERDLELGDIIRSVIPYAVKWYTGELQDEDEEAEEEEEEYEGDDQQVDDEENEEGDEEEEEEEEDENNEKKKEECKQQ